MTLPPLACLLPIMHPGAMCSPEECNMTQPERLSGSAEVSAVSPAALLDKRHHWSGRVNECSLRRSSDGELGVELRGGAQSGHFSYISAVRKDVVYQYGQLSEGDILLEVEGLPVSGLPLYDVLSLLDNTKDPVRLKTVRQGKGRELADMMERRKVDILCVQETRWKGSKARSIEAGFKLFHYGVDSKRNGVGVVLKEEFVRNVLEVGCELEEKERFWSELDEVMESIPTGERVVIGADLNGHVGEGNTGDEEVMGKFGVKERNLEGQMVLLPDDWETTAEVIRETGRKVLGVSSGRRKEDKETWWWNEEVQDSIQRKRLAKKKWDMDRTEENREEYKELQRRVKREVSKAKQKAYGELYTRLDTREGEKDLYRLARQRDRDGKNVQQVRVIKLLSY
ncbi:hypothetical protein QTP70_012023 [Hemibagrus guttatus]|uniref:PDZ domain-containing protein n=1 Tax=Hemibagrus guttatus TaxID=175788 RepID=A0AAE0R2F8_9TELE|nr:hypothetical protein QTP70_012023 [Hemibagrus guttatus]